MKNQEVQLILLVHSLCSMDSEVFLQRGHGGSNGPDGCLKQLEAHMSDLPFSRMRVARIEENACRDNVLTFGGEVQGGWRPEGLLVLKLS